MDKEQENYEYDADEEYGRFREFTSHNVSFERRSERESCEHDMVYSQTLGVVGGYCRKCGYKTY
jgi:hypothetical protein